MIRGEVYLGDLEPHTGNEMAKERPVVIVSRDNPFNQNAPVIVICPITDAKNKRTGPQHVFVPAGEGNLVKDSVVHCLQVRSVDKTRLSRKIGELTPETMKKVEAALKFVLNLSD